MSIEDPRLSSIDNTSAADDFDSAVEQHLGFASETVEGIEVAQAETPDAGRTDRLPAQQPVDVAAAVIPSEVTPDNENVVTLPAGIELDNLEFQVDGENLVLVLADGTEITVIGAAANIPTFVVGDVELPQVALFAALEESNINVAAGPDGTFSAQSTPDGSRNFEDNQIGDGFEEFALAGLLADTGFADEANSAATFGGNGSPSITAPLTTPFIYDEAVIAGGAGAKIISGRLPFNQGPDFGTISAIGFSGASDVNEGDGLKVLSGFTSAGRTILITSFPAPTDGTDLDFVALEGRDTAGNLVFTITVTNRVTGDFTFELFGKLEHPDAGLNGSQDDLDDLLRLGFTYTVTDRDGDSVTGLFNIDVQDDAPTIGSPVGDSIEEDDLTEKYEGPSPQYVKALSETSSDDGFDLSPRFKFPTAEGSLAIRWGADDDLKSEDLRDENPNDDDPVGRTVSFTGLDTASEYADIVAAMPVLDGLRSDGALLSYRIERTVDDAGIWNGGYQLIAFKNGRDGYYDGEKIVGERMPLDGPLYDGPGYDFRTVFIITLDPTSATGTYTFELVGNLDHYEPVMPTDGDDGQISDSLDLPASDGPEVQVFVESVSPNLVGKPVDYLDFKIPYTATDSDGDSVDGIVTVRITDDAPVKTGDGNHNALVDEDDVAAIANVQPAGTDRNNSPSFSGQISKVNFGADGFGSMAFSGAFNVPNENSGTLVAGDNVGLDSGLTSDGDAVFFRLVDGGLTIEGFVPGRDGELVFMATLNGTDRGYTVNLLGNIDHQPGTEGRGNAQSLNFDVRATDGDGDFVDVNLSIRITDDAPVKTGDGNHNALVDEDDVAAIVNVQPAGTDRNNSPSFSGQISKVNFGADGFGSMAFSGAFNVPNENSGTLVAGDSVGLDSGLTSDGDAVFFRLVDGGLTIEGFVPGRDGELVFTATLNGTDRGYTVNLLGNIDHQPGTEGRGNAQSLNFDVRATDGDGDFVDVNLSIRITDDAPVKTGDGNHNALVDEDDVAAIANVQPAGTDRNNSPSFSGQISKVNFGADGFGSMAFSGAFNVPNENSGTLVAGDSVGLDSGLTSDGDAVFFRLVDGGLTIEGFVPGRDGELVFTATLNGTDRGYAVNLLGNIDHQPGAEGRGNAQSLNFDVRATDGDGDFVDVNLSIRITDDAPLATGSETGTVAENDLASFNPLYPLVFDFWQGSNGTSPYDGTSSDNSNTGLLGTVPVWGTLADNIIGGADDRGSFNLVTAAEAEEILKTLGPDDGYLTSKGDAINDARMITIDGVGDAMGFFASDGRLVFGLLVAENGTYNFRLFDQVDHPVGDNAETDAPEAVADTIAIDLSALVTFTDFDGDKIALGDDRFVISITDDIPEVVGNLEVTLNEGDLSNFLSPVNLLLVALGAPVVGSNGNEQDPDGLLDGLFGTTSASGFLNRLFGDKVVAGGADETGKFELVTEARAEALLAEAGWRSNGLPITNARIVAIEGLGQAMGFFTEDGRMVVSLALGNGPLGAYDIRVWDQLDHSGHDDLTTEAVETAFEDTLALNLGQFITYTDADGDRIDLDGDVTLKVVDDIPVVVGNLALTLNEGDLSNFLAPVNILLLALGAPVVGSNGNEQDADGLLDQLFGTTSASGFLNELFGDKLVSAGADEIGRFGLVTEVQAEALLLAAGWSSKGSEITDARMITLEGIGQAMGLFTEDGRMVVSLTLGNGPLGAYDIRIWDQLDHQVGDNPNTGAPEAFEDTLALNLGQFITYTDADGDKIGLDGHVTLNVIDDIPEVVGTKTISLDEDDLSSFNPIWSPVLAEYLLVQGSNGTDQDPDGLFDDLLGTTSQSGLLNGLIGDKLVSGGADEMGKFGLVSEAHAETLLGNLSSKGHAINDVRALQLPNLGSVLGFFTNDGRLVMTLAVSEAGLYDVRLFDQLDHEYGNNGENHLEIDLSKFVTYTDADGDKIDLGAGTLVLDVKDDAPIASGATVVGTVEEEHNQLSGGDLNHGNEDGDDANGLDQDVGPDFVLNPLVYLTANFTSGDLKTLVTTGSDEGGAFSLTTNVSGLVMTAGESPVVVKSKGQPVQLDFSGGQIVGFVDVNNNGTYEPGDRQVFTLTANANGGFTFTLLDQVDHTFGDNIEDILTLNLGPAVTYTDKDGDVVTLTSGLNIRVIDDTPIADINLNSNKYLTLDETLAGTPSAVGDANANDEVGAAASPLVGAAVIGYATDSGAGSLFNNVSKVGADEGVTSTYALKIGNNGASGLLDAQTNAAITLELGTGDLAGMVLGKYGSGPNDIAFVVKIDPQTGATTVWQYRAVEHNNDGASPDDSVSFANGSLQIEATVSDFDGDKSTDTVDLGGRIQFQDDGSVITNVETVGIAMNWPVEISATGDIEVAYGSDGAAATNPLVISGWPTIPGVPAVLSSDGLTLTQNSYNGQPLYTLKLDATTGEYEFKLHQEWPDTPSQAISVLSGDFANRASGSYSYANGAVTFTNIDPYNGGFGVNNNQLLYSGNEIEKGESFGATFATAMQQVVINLNVNADLVLNGTVTVTWTAANGGPSETGTVVFNANGSATLTINPSIDFTSLQISVTTSDTGLTPGGRFIQVTGLTGTTAPIVADDQDLQFQVTATDGDGDKSNKPLIVHLEAVPEVAVTNATVDEAGLPSRTGGSAGTDEAADRNNYDNDVNSEVATGTITISSTDGLGEVRFTNEGNQTTVVSLAQLNGSGTTPVVVFDDATGKLEITGYNAGVISYRYTLENNVDHRVEGAGALDYTVVAVDPDNFQSFPVKLTITIDNDAPAAVGSAQTGSLSETGLPLVDSDFGSLNVNVGADSQNMRVEIKTDAMDKPIINSGLSSDGVPLEYEVRTINGVDQELVAYKQGESVAKPVFIVSVLHPGSFATTLFQNLDHLGDADTTLKLDLVARVFDGEGDYVDQPFSINIADTIPTAIDLTDAMGENQSLEITLTEGTDFSFGSDSTGTAVSIGTVSLSNGPSGVTLGLPTVNFDPDTNKISIVPGTAFDALAAGQMVVLHIPYTVKDGDNDMVTKDIAVTVTGTNDAPAIIGWTSGLNPGEQVDASAQVLTPVNGSIIFRDVDVGDTISGQLAGTPTISWSGGSLSPSQVTALTAALVTDKIAFTDTATSNGASGTVHWTWSPAAADLDFLSSGENLTVTFQMQVYDGTAASNTVAFTVSVAGNNDAPTLTASLTNVTYTDTSGNDTFTDATGDLASADKDTNASRTYGITGGSASGDPTGFNIAKAGAYGTLYLNTSTGAYKYVPNDTAIEAAVDDQKDFFEFTVNDGVVTATQAFTVNIDGVPEGSLLTLNESTSAGGRYAFTQNGHAPDALNFSTASLFAGESENTGYSYQLVSATDSRYQEWLGTGATVTGNPDEQDIESGWTWPWYLPFPIYTSEVTDDDGDSGLYIYKVTATDAGSLQETYVAFSAIEGDGTTINITNNGSNSNSGSLSWANANNSDGDLITINHNINATLNAGAGHDVVVGSANAETVDGGSGDDALYGMGDDDDLRGASGNDFIDGGDGDDTITGGTGNDVLLGGSGDDKFNYTIGDGADTIVGGSGTDTVAITGTGNNDTLNVVVAGGVVTQFNGSTVANVELVTADLGGATDTLSYVGTTQDVVVNLGAPAATGFSSIANIESVTGGSGNDMLTGSASANTLTGGDGEDTLTGGAGADRLTGGSGADTFNFSSGNATVAIGGSGNNGTISGYDVITDFSTAQDKLSFTTTPFVAGNGAVDGTNSTLTISNRTVKSHSISNGIITFDDENNYDSALTLNSEARVAAVVQYLRANDLGNAGVTVAFTATFGGTEHTYIYQQVGDTPNAANDLLLDLRDVTLTSGGTSLVTLFTNSAIDPLVLDLDHNGFALSSIDNGVTFDINADGHKDQIAWTSDDGILAYDVDGNGVIDNGSEIFTPDFNGGKFASGVAALASLDSNGDGKIDANDDAFSKLQVWVDADNDGVSDEGELSSLSANGVASISLTTDQTGGEEDGQTVFAEGEFTFADGSTGNFLEVGFDTIFGSDNDGLTLHGGMGEVVMTGGAGADTFVFDGTALDGLDVADVITDFSTKEGDVLDVTALLDSLLGEQPDATVETHLRATIDEGNTTVSVQTGQDNWKDVVVLQNHDTAIKVLFDDKHATVTPHD